MTRTIRTSIVVSVIVVIAMGTSACFKKSAEPSKTVSRLLASIPADAFGYIFWDGSGDPFMRYRKSPWSKGTDLFSNDLVSMTGNAKASPKNVLKALEQSGLLGTEQSPSSLNSFVGYAAGNPTASIPEERFEVSFLGELKDEQAGQKIVSVLKNEFSGVTDTEVVDGCGDYQGFHIQPSDPKDGEFKFFACVKDKKLVVTNLLEKAGSLFGDSPTELTDKHLLKTAQLEKISQSIKSKDKEYFFLYVDTTRFVQSMPAELQKEMKVESLPISAFALSRQMFEGPKDVAMLLMGESKEAKEISDILSSKGSLQALQHIDESSAFTIGLDMRIYKAFESLRSHLAPDVTLKELNLLKNILSFGIGIEKAAAGSPFPTVSLVATGSNTKELKAELESNISKQVSGSGLPAGSWQSKDVAGTQMRYIATPFGVGLYAGAEANTFVLSSSETGFKNGIKAGDKNLLATLEDEASEEDPQDALALTYIDFTKVADIVTNVQQTLSMFMGGKSNLVSGKQIEEIKSLGTALGTLHYEDQLITFSNIYSSPKTQG